MSEVPDMLDKEKTRCVRAEIKHRQRYYLANLLIKILEFANKE